jgi:hypothetical protein
MSSLQIGRGSLIGECKISSFRKIPELESSLLEASIDIARSPLNTSAKVTSHLVRILSVLWRIVAVGTGEPDLVWANPTAPLPLRVQAFASLLHIVGATTMYMAKNGAKILNGAGDLNVVEMGRALALLFDERSLFGSQGAEVSENLESEVGNGNVPCDSSGPTRKKRHVRQTFELFGETAHQRNHANPSFQQSVATRQEKNDPKFASIPDNLGPGELEVFLSQPQTAIPPLKIDTKSDFQSALRAAISDEDFNRLENGPSEGATLADAMKPAFHSFGGSMVGNRRWMTLPVRSLSTIREAELDEREDADVREDELGVCGKTNVSHENGDTLESAMLKMPTKSVRQMRVPNLKKAATLGPRTTVEISKLSNASESWATDDEIERVGSAFLDLIGKSLSLK